MSARKSVRTVLAALAVVSLATSGCDRSTSMGPHSVLAPQAAVVFADGQEYTRVEDRIPIDIDDLRVSKLIGLTGGQISLAGHALTVPAGAVRLPTVFTMILTTNGYLQVEMLALRTDVFGGLLDEGMRGFAKPLTLEMSYARSPNVIDPARLRIAQLSSGDPDSVTPLPSQVDELREVVSARLWHFTGYCVIQ